MDDTVTEPVVADVFPAKVVGPGRTVTRCRAYLTRTRLIVYQDRKPRRPSEPRFVIPVHETLAVMEPDGTGWTATTVTGEVWTISPTGWCKCGSSLRQLPKQGPPIY